MVIGSTSIFRTIFKTQHGKVLFLSLKIQGNGCTIMNCFYLDRNRGRTGIERYRSIYVELAYYKDGNGVVKQCHYYDRIYKRQNIQITPPMLTSCFFPYSKKDILSLLNHEICYDFTHIIVTDGIDLEFNTMPLCGAL